MPICTDFDEYVPFEMRMHASDQGTLIIHGQTGEGVIALSDQFVLALEAISQVMAG